MDQVEAAIIPELGGVPCAPCTGNWPFDRLAAKSHRAWHDAGHPERASFTVRHGTFYGDRHEEVVECVVGGVPDDFPPHPGNGPALYGSDY